MSEEKPKYLGSWKGRVIKSIAIDGAKSFNEIRESTGLYYNTLKRVLAELHTANAITYNDETKIYRVEYNLYKEYEKYFQDEQAQRKALTKVKISKEAQEEFTRWIDNWKDNNDSVDFDLKHKHFYLEGSELEEFTKYLISKATAEILIVNYLIERTHLAENLRKPAQDENIVVRIVIRPIDDDKKREYHKLLKDSGVEVFYNETVHAKLVVVDRAVAIVSSMNFTVFSTGGQSWEAGMVTIEPNIANTVADSILNIIEVQETVEMK